MGTVFLCYRRVDRHAAGRLHKILVEELGEGNVFKDDHDIPYGKDFAETIRNTIQACDALFAVVGPQWLNLLDAHLSNGEPDWPRIEIECAFDYQLLVVPFLIDNSEMPKADQLPTGIKAFADCQASPLPNTEFFEDAFRKSVKRIKQDTESFRDNLGDLHSTDERLVRQRRGRRVLLGMVALWMALYIWWEWWPPGRIDQAALGRLVHETYWVSYDPSEMTIVNGQPNYGSRASIERDLDMIKEAGFTGIVTSSCESVMADAPRLAKSRGLRVIMGVWDPSRRDQLSRAIRQREYVDAYCVGHDDVDTYFLENVEQGIRLIKKRTGLPVATTEKVNRYNPQLESMGDWLFPDVHIPIRDGSDRPYRVDVDRDFKLFERNVRRMAETAKKINKPLLVKNVAYPHGGIDNASPESQRAFYAKSQNLFRDSQSNEIAVNVSIVAQGAFDAPWKTDALQYHPWDKHTGLIDPTAKPSVGARTTGAPQVPYFARPAVAVLVRDKQLDTTNRNSGRADGNIREP